jgi:drug/metabolite transporter (DMT)-like permease
MKNNNISLKILFLIVLNDVGDSIAQLFLKKGFIGGGMSSVHLSNIGEFVSRNISSPWVWLGLFIYVMNFFIWIIVLYRVDLSVAMPVGSTSYIIIPVLAVLFLGEHVSLLRWAGTIMIAVGIYFALKSPSAKIERVSA